MMVLAGYCRSKDVLYCCDLLDLRNIFKIYSKPVATVQAANTQPMRSMVIAERESKKALISYGSI